ncbi:MAG: DUF420 domain-containing protein [Spirochaetia bacterium]|nr:DUF420 domain-containing protein [Spirochaetia bacterium]
MNIESLPGLFSSFNALSFISLLIGYFFIKNDKENKHRIAMMCALSASALFLVLYLYYYISIGEVFHYQKHGWIRYVYFTLLISHVILSVIVLPFIVKMVVHALKGQKEKHKATARWVFPVWVYVSFTGMIIYVMLWKI